MDCRLYTEYTYRCKSVYAYFFVFTKIYKTFRFGTNTKKAVLNEQLFLYI